MDPETMREVVALAQAGKVIEAIKLYRQMTNCGLAEAKTAVDNIRAGRPIQPVQAYGEAPNEGTTGGSMRSDQKAEIRRLMQANQKIEAIKLYRQITGVGLKEAKDAVEALAN